MSEQFNFYMPTKIIFGANKINQLSTLKLPGTKALIVTTNGGSIRRSGTLDRVISQLEANQISHTLFQNVSANPSTDSISEGTLIAKKEGCDFIIGLGGGSAIDTSKAIAVLCKNGENFWDYIQRGSGGKKFPSNGALPIIAIPTTAGTGSETDPWLVVSNLATNEKIGCGWEFTYPTISIVDPTLMLSVPKYFTAIQGMDAFFHAAEGYIATCSTPVSELFSLQAIQSIAQYLPIAVKDGTNLEARSKVAWASTEAGIVESLSDTVSQHYISHAITALHEDIAHGAALIAICIPYFSHFVDIIPEKLTKMALAMGVPDTFQSPHEGALAFIHALKKLISDIDMDNVTLQKLGVVTDEIPAIVRKAYITDGHLFSITPDDITEDSMVHLITAHMKENNYESK